MQALGIHSTKSIYFRQKIIIRINVSKNRNIYMLKVIHRINTCNFSNQIKTFDESRD